MPICSSWRTHSSHVTLETPEAITSLFVVSVEPFFSSLLEHIQSCFAFAPSPTSETDAFPFLLIALFVFLESLSHCFTLNFLLFPKLSSSLVLHRCLGLKAPVYRLFSFLRRSSTISSSTQRLMQNRHSMPTVCREKNRMDEKVGKLVFPTGCNSKNVVFGSSADSLVMSFIETATSLRTSRVVFIPGFLCFPHASVVPMFMERAIQLVGYEVDRITYGANVSELKKLLLSHHQKRNETCFLILPSLQGRRIHNVGELCEMAHSMGIFTIELVVPTISMYHCPPNESSIDSRHTNRSPDVFIVSFKAISFLDGAIGAFKNNHRAMLVRERIVKSKTPSLVQTWVQLMQQYLRMFLCSPIGFGFCIQWVTFCSSVMDALVKVSKRKDEKNSAHEPKVHPSDLGKAAHRWIEKACSSSTSAPGYQYAQSMPSRTQLANLLLLFTRYIGESTYCQQVGETWSFLRNLPSHIDVISIGDPASPLATTEVMSSSGLILYAIQPDEVVDVLYRKGFHAVKLMPREVHDCGLTAMDWRDRMIYFSNTQIGASMASKLVLFPFNASMKSKAKKRLQEALIEMPPSWFGKGIDRSYITHEVEDVLEAVASRLYYIPPVISKL